MRKGTKRKTTHKGESPSKPAEDQENGRSESPSKPDKENHLEEKSRNGAPERSKKAAAQGRPKRAKVSKPEAEPEYFPEKRNLEDLWQQVFPVGTEWDQLDMVYQYKWNFSNLERTYLIRQVKKSRIIGWLLLRKEGGELYNKKVYLFGCTEPQLVSFQGQGEVTMIPVVVAVVSPFPPSDKIGIKSVQRETEEILPMKQMKMDWTSTIQEDELEQSTVVQLLFPIDPKPVFCEFDWELDELEEFTDKLIEEEELPADQKEAFKDFVKEKVREAKKANREAREARKKALAEMSAETKAAFENMRFYKFYPVSTPDTPDVSSVKIKVIRPFLASSCIAVALHQQILWEGTQGYMSGMPRTSHLRKEATYNSIACPWQ
ncbi:UNVERIFIED_CONTAM: protein HEAT INTOLERANT 4 [Sesamum latifolium]|uniref:Protein HEAT INTOLERANT 4 n=1 Tax=Sesamum latifolium TaxID=2727402 RepID=A0AAW2Y5W5_9LAMI